MTARTLDSSFVAFAASRGLDIATGNPVAGVFAMLDFYAAQRFQDCDVEADGDMLLFQWGIYDWGQGEHFEVDLTRQVILVGEVDDDAIWQLHLTYRFSSDDELRGLGEGERWCAAPGQVAEFTAFIESTSAYPVLAGRKPARVLCQFERAG